jgi:hypothetical protein
MKRPRLVLTLNIERGSEKGSCRFRSRVGSTTPYRVRDPEKSIAPFWRLRKSITTDGKDHLPATSNSSFDGAGLNTMFRYAAGATQGARVLKDALAFSWSSNRRKSETRLSRSMLIVFAMSAGVAAGRYCRFFGSIVSNWAPLSLLGSS